jgi:AcrR family transcriptional regulator
LLDVPERDVVSPNVAKLPLRERKRLRSQQHMYDVAVELIIERGYGNVTVDDICERAEVARATFFRYFGSKSGLLIEFERRIEEEIERRLAASPVSAAEALVIVQRAMTDAWAQAHPNLHELGADYMASTSVGDIGRVAAGIVNLTAQVIDRGVADGELRQVMPSKLAAHLFVTSVRMTSTYWMSSSKRRARNETAAVVELFLRGLAAD